MATSIGNLRAELERKAKDIGADLFGVADITRLHEYLSPRGGEYLREFPRAIAIGVRFPDGAVDQLVQHHNLSSIWTWRYTLFEVVVPTLDRVTFSLARALEDAGHRSYLMFNGRIDEHESMWAYPLKLTGYLAGLGWMGKNRLIINPEFGPRFRMSVVLTDAPFAVDSPQPVRCGKCTDCIDTCPAKALSAPTSFDPSGPREDWSHAKVCASYVGQRADELPFPDRKASCALCVYSCPFGKRKYRGSIEEKEVQHV